MDKNNNKVYKITKIQEMNWLEEFLNNFISLSGVYKYLLLGWQDATIIHHSLITTTFGFLQIFRAFF